MPAPASPQAARRIFGPVSATAACARVRAAARQEISAEGPGQIQQWRVSLIPLVLDAFKQISFVNALAGRYWRIGAHKHFPALYSAESQAQ